MSDGSTGALEAMSDAVLAIAAERSVERVLRRLVHAARELAGARYAALGVPDGEGNFAQFITAGMSGRGGGRDGAAAAHARAARRDARVAERRTARDDIRRDPRFRGWWPARASRGWRSFLGVPIVARGGVIGAFYLTDKEDAPEFCGDDQRLIEMLAAHAAIAIENARLLRAQPRAQRRSRSATGSRATCTTRVVQKLFGVVLTAQSAADAARARRRATPASRSSASQELAQEAIGELRSLVFQLRPAGDRGGGAGRRAAQARRACCGACTGCRSSSSSAATRGCGPGVDEELFRIAQEALHNALRHAGREHDRGPSRRAARRRSR